jgi:hypothetical protein
MLHCFLVQFVFFFFFFIGRQRNGLYLLLPLNSSHFCLQSNSKDSHILNSVKTSTDSFHLWHCRLGHPFLSRMSLLCKIVPYVTCSNNSTPFCTVCPMEKQKRLPFPHPNILCAVPFDCYMLIFEILFQHQLLEDIETFSLW